MDPEPVRVDSSEGQGKAQASGAGLGFGSQLGSLGTTGNVTLEAISRGVAAAVLGGIGNGASQELGVEECDGIGESQGTIVVDVAGISTK